MVLAAGPLTGGAAAGAGGWAETVLDPPPARVEAGTTYTFGYWVLQHGSYPIRGDDDLGPTALTATDETGAVVEFAGTALATAGHYSAEVVFPHDGPWTIGGEHGVLMPDVHVATVTVPGPVVVTPSDVTTRAHHEWGPVRPSFPPSAPDASLGVLPTEGEVEPVPLVDPRAVEPKARTSADGADTAAADVPGAPLPVWVVIAAGLGTVGFAFWLARRGLRARP